MSKALGSLVFLAIPIALASKFFETVGYVIPIVLVVVFGLLALFVSYAHKEERKNTLFDKYKDKSIVDKIMSKTIWDGQTAEQLKESLGSPVAIDEKYLKTIKREVWKYNQRTKTSFGLRITLDNDVVTQWDKKA